MKGAQYYGSLLFCMISKAFINLHPIYIPFPLMFRILEVIGCFLILSCDYCVQHCLHFSRAKDLKREYSGMEEIIIKLKYKLFLVNECRF